MDFSLLPEQNNDEQAHTGANACSEWVTVAEAVAYCSSKGLSRTQKTIRKWAHHSSSQPENAELKVRREDVDNGFRWTIERDSLDRKIEQELEFEARRARNSKDLVRPEADGFELERTGADAGIGDEANKVSSAPAKSGVHQSEPVPGETGIIQQLEARIEDLKGEVEFCRDELRDRRQTTLALTDVIEAFRLTAASNASRAQGLNEHRTHDVRSNHRGDKSSRDSTDGAVQ